VIGPPLQPEFEPQSMTCCMESETGAAFEVMACQLSTAAAVANE